jgi:hypothetical protein
VGGCADLNAGRACPVRNGFPVEGIAVADVSAVEVFVFERFEESLDDTVGLQGLMRAPVAQQRSSPVNAVRKVFSAEAGAIVGDNRNGRWCPAWARPISAASSSAGLSALTGSSACFSRRTSRISQMRRGTESVRKAQIDCEGQEKDTDDD